MFYYFFFRIKNYSYKQLSNKPLYSFYSLFFSILFPFPIGIQVIIHNFQVKGNSCACFSFHIKSYKKILKILKKKM